MSPTLDELALDLALEFGPRRAVPLRERIAEARPGATRREVRRAIAAAGRVQARAYELTSHASADGTPALDPAEVVEALSREFPAYSADALAHAQSQAAYWHLRD